MAHQHHEPPAHHHIGEGGVAGHASADDEYLYTPPGAGYEHTDASVWIIVKFGLWLVVSAIVIHIGLWFTFELMVQWRETPVKDNEWFDYHVKVQGNKITITVGGKTMVEYVEAADREPIADMPGRKLSSGTFALQAHDPGSTAYFREIYVKPLD